LEAGAENHPAKRVHLVNPDGTRAGERRIRNGQRRPFAGDDNHRLVGRRLIPVWRHCLDQCVLAG
jgi:hypothetical protein